MQFKRNKTILLILLLIIFILSLRVLYIQVFSYADYSKTSSAQRTISTKIDHGRGEILDRNGITFTDREDKTSVILKPMLITNIKDMKKISDTLKLDFSKLKDSLSYKTKPLVVEGIDKQAEKSLINIKGVSILHALRRYDEESYARHIIGYMDGTDNVGRAGIEKKFEDILNTKNVSSIEVVTDARKVPLKGLGYRLVNNSNNPDKLNVKLTLDLHIQKIVEEVMNKYRIEGAVVIEDVSNGDIIALASKPDFDQNNVVSFLDSPKNELFNKAVAAYNVGSIFKIIDSALAFETGYDPERLYDCKGYIDIGDKQLKCTSYYKGGHGIVNLSSAFAKSCNPFFINMSLQLGYESILKMAARFGLGRPTGIKNQGVDEAAGNLPDMEKYHSDGDLANICIGQGDILVTPLQAADLVATVANGGIKNKVNIVDAIVNENGIKVKNIREKDGERIISKHTADKIKTLMEEAVINGTGKNADIPQLGGAAGKTGSAETGQSINNQMVVQAWFAGYFPRRDPKYSISVFVENGKMGGEAAAPVFKDIAQEIMERGL